MRRSFARSAACLLACTLLSAAPVLAEPEPTPAPTPEASDTTPVASQFSGYKPTFFLTGLTNDERLQALIQFSVKFNFWPSPSPHSVYFGYTQKSVWAIWDFPHSQPFLESNYNPEIFYGYLARLTRPAAAANWHCQLIEVRSGLEHESNGIGEVNPPPPGERSSSRGWNRIYGYGKAGCSLPKGSYLTADFKLWPIVFGAFDNPDITDYLGYGALGFEGGIDRPLGGSDWIAGLSYGATFTAALAHGHGGVNAWLQIRPTYGGGTLQHYLPALYIRVFKGYGETLLRYDQDVTTVYAGISLDDHLTWGTEPQPKEK